MWYFHSIFSGNFVIGVIGNLVAAVIGFMLGLIAAHKVYDLRAIHRTIKEHTEKHHKPLSDRYQISGH